MIVKEADELHKKERSAQAVQLEAVVYSSSSFRTPVLSFVLDVAPVKGMSGSTKMVAIRFNQLEFKPVYADYIDSVLKDVLFMMKAELSYAVGEGNVQHTSSRIHNAVLVVSRWGVPLLRSRWGTCEELEKMVPEQLRWAMSLSEKLV